MKKKCRVFSQGGIIFIGVSIGTCKWRPKSELISYEWRTEAVLFCEESVYVKSLGGNWELVIVTRA